MEQELIARSWRDTDAIHTFVGDECRTAKSYPEDERYLLAASTVEHYDVIDQVPTST